MVEVLETASLGPKRQLVVARMGDQLLLLAASEAGINLLSTQPVPVASCEPLREHEIAPELPAPDPAPARIQGLWSRFRGPTAPTPSRSFEDLLQETADDLELRRKLASGRSGRVA
jgi:flagellar biogenesis protein FliO